MFGIIQLSQIAFGVRVSSLKTAKDSLKGVAHSHPELNSESKVIDLYKSQFDELVSLVSTYAAFLETDITLISDTGKELINMDNQLGQSLASGIR